MVIELVLSIPEAIISVAVMTIMIVKIAKNPSSVLSWEWGTGVPLILTGNTALGCKSLWNSLRNTFITITARTHLKPPVVDPEQAPINIRHPKITHVIWGHRAASSLNSPVVVMNDTTIADATLRKSQREAFLNAYNEACDSLNELGLKRYRDIIMKRCRVTPAVVDSLPSDIQFTPAHQPLQQDVDRAVKWLNMQY